VSATIGAARVTIYLDESFSLKDKRREVRSISKQVQTKFNAAIAEIEDLDDMRVATLGIVVVSNDARHADAMLATIIAFVEARLDLGVLGEIGTELFPFSG
jgi:uncharacterized protein YlxP (DUF503 family)